MFNILFLSKIPKLKIFIIFGLIIAIILVHTSFKNDFTIEDNNLSWTTLKLPLDNTCQPKYNIVFLKTHKCGTNSILTIFVRYGYLNHKVFVLPKKGIYLGKNEEYFNSKMVPDPKVSGHEYNILAHHTRFNYNEIMKVMPKTSVFVTIIRDPIKRFQSAYNSFKLNEFWKFDLDDFYNENKTIPMKIYNERKHGRHGINQMMFDLGLNTSDFSNSSAVKNYILKLDSIFDLVLITERFDESLVLLKHLLCWKTEDIISFKINERKYSAKNKNLTETAIKRMGDVNWADTQLYNYFSKKFSNLVKNFGKENMDRELTELKNKTQILSKYCISNEKNVNCIILNNVAGKFIDRLRDRQEREFPGSVYDLTITKDRLKKLKRLD